MKTIVLAGDVMLALLTGAAFASTSPSEDVSTDAMLASGIQTTQQFNSIGTVPAACRPYVRTVAPSWSNPTGQVEHGPSGTISLFAPTDNGNG
jgi:hypothetical protein